MRRRLFAFVLFGALWAASAGAQTFETFPTVSGSTYGVNVTCGVAGDTKGSYVQIAAATSFTSSRVWVSVPFTIGALQDDILIDLAIGAAASEVIIVNNIGISSAESGGVVGAWIPFDVNIPSGSRVAMRCQSDSGGSDQFQAQIYLENRAAIPVSNVVTYGANTTTSMGTPVDTGGTANTKGAYAVIGTTSAAHNVFVIVIVMNNNTGPAVANFAFDVATGAPSSEVIILPDIPMATTADGYFPFVHRFSKTLPSGTAISVRGQATTNDATDRVFGVIIYGMTEPAGVGAGVF